MIRTFSESPPNSQKLFNGGTALLRINHHLEFVHLRYFISTSHDLQVVTEINHHQGGNKPLCAGGNLPTTWFNIVGKPFVVVVQQQICLSVPSQQDPSRSSSLPLSNATQPSKRLAKRPSLAPRHLAPGRSALHHALGTLAVHPNRHLARLAQLHLVRCQEMALLVVGTRDDNALHNVLSMLAAIEQYLLHAGDLLLPLPVRGVRLGAALRCLLAGFFVVGHKIVTLLEDLLAGFEEWVVLAGPGGWRSGMGLRGNLGIGVGFLDEHGVLVARFAPMMHCQLVYPRIVVGAVIIQLVNGTDKESIKLVSFRLNGSVESLGELSFVTLLLLVEFDLPVGPSLRLAMSQAAWSAAEINIVTAGHERIRTCLQAIPHRTGPHRNRRPLPPQGDASSSIGCLENPMDRRSSGLLLRSTIKVQETLIGIFQASSLPLAFLFAALGGMVISTTDTRYAT